MRDPIRETQARRRGLKPVIVDRQHHRREGQTLAGSSLLARYINFVRLPHTVFALPFALLGVVYASFAAPVSVVQISLVIVAFTAARFAAMGFNRIVDLDLDRMNPRTRARELPGGRLSVRQAVVAVVIAAAVFVGAAAMLNPVCLALSPIALAWILSYSYTKRFTDWSHLWLGAALAMAPVGGYLAVTGEWSSPVWTLLVLAVSVATWVGGFDIFYALQDAQFDRRNGLRSLVVGLGENRAILVAKLLHGVTIVGLLVFGVGTAFGTAYYVGVGLAAAILAWEHRLVHPTDLSRLDAAFFTMNGIMSIILFAGALGGRLL